jgi:hypothetical protein
MQVSNYYTRCAHQVMLLSRFAPVMAFVLQIRQHRKREPRMLWLGTRPEVLRRHR